MYFMTDGELRMPYSVITETSKKLLIYQVTTSIMNYNTNYINAFSRLFLALIVKVLDYIIL